MNNYEIVKFSVPTEEMERFIRSIQNSFVYRLNNEGFIVEASTHKRVGFIGRDTFYLVGAHDRTLEPYHSMLLKIFESIKIDEDAKLA